QHSDFRAPGHRRVTDRWHRAHQSRSGARVSHRRSIAVSTQNNKSGSDDILRPQVVVIETPEKSGAGIAEPLAPRVIATAGTGRIIPAPPADLQPTVELDGRRY